MDEGLLCKWDGANIEHVAHHDIRPAGVEEVLANEAMDVGYELVNAMAPPPKPAKQYNPPVVAYGNVTQSVIYPYNNTTTPLRTYVNTYVTSSGYLSNYVRNRLLTSTLTTLGVTKTLATNTYYTINLNGSPLPQYEMDQAPAVPAAYRGLLYQSVTPAQTVTYSYSYGAVAQACGASGCVSATTSASTNYAAPSSISTPTYGETLSYNSWLGVTSTTGLNGEQLSMVYDGYGRPRQGVSPYGAVTSYSYSPNNILPVTQTTQGPGGTTVTTLDGLGRPIRVQHGTGVTDTVYEPCACSPLGKIQKVSAPYQSGGSASGRTVYGYDGIGRTVSTTLPDGASATTYSYSGNLTTVTDPINGNDPTGKTSCIAGDDETWEDDGDGYGCEYTGESIYETGGSAVIGSATGTGCLVANEQYYPENGTCDMPTYLAPQTTQFVNQVGSNLAGANTLLGVAAAPYLIPAGLGAATAITGVLAGPTAGLLAGETPVLGTVASTTPYVGLPGYNALPAAGYNLAVQASYMGGVVASGQSILLSSSLPAAPGSMLAIEVGFLQAILNYERFGNLLVPPVP